MSKTDTIPELRLSAKHLVVYNTEFPGRPGYTQGVHYRAKQHELIVGLEANSPDCSVVEVGSTTSPHWLNKGFFTNRLEQARAEGAEVINLRYTPASTEGSRNDLRAGQVVNETLLFLANNPSCTVYLVGCEAFLKWARRLDSPTYSNLENWQETYEQAYQLLTYDDVYRDTQRRQNAAARRALAAISEPALAWRVALEHFEHFVCGRVEFPHDCSRSAPYRQTVRQQLLEFYAEVAARPAWAPVLQEMEDSELLGPGSSFSVPILGELVSAATTVGGLGIVGAVCAGEAIADRLGRAKTQDAIMFAGAVAAVPLFLGYSAAKGVCDSIGRGYVRWKRRRGERVSPTRFTHFAPGTAPL